MSNSKSESKNKTAPSAPPATEQTNQQTPPIDEKGTQSAPPETTPTSPAEEVKQAPAKLVKFRSKFAKHTLNFDGIPKIEFTPVSSSDANKGGEFETINIRQINALRECEAFRKRVITEVK